MANWMFQAKANGYAWTAQNSDPQHLCQVIIWNNNRRGWCASGMLNGPSERAFQFNSQQEGIQGLDACLEWVWGFARENHLPTFNVLEARHQVLGQMQESP